MSHYELASALTVQILNCHLNRDVPKHVLYTDLMFLILEVLHASVPEYTPSGN